MKWLYYKSYPLSHLCVLKCLKRRLSAMRSGLLFRPSSTRGQCGASPVLAYFSLFPAQWKFAAGQRRKTSPAPSKWQPRPFFCLQIIPTGEFWVPSLESLLKLRPESEKKCVKDPTILRHTPTIIRRTSAQQAPRVLRGRELFPGHSIIIRQVIEEQILKAERLEKQWQLQSYYYYLYRVSYYWDIIALTFF